MNYKIIISLFGKKPKLEDIEFIPKVNLETFIPKIDTDIFLPRKWKTKKQNTK